MVVPDFLRVMESILLGRLSTYRKLPIKKNIAHETPPPTVPVGNEYRLAVHVIPELYALLGINRQNDDNRTYLTGIYKDDIDIPCSPDTKRIIQSGLFSSEFSIFGIPVWSRSNDGRVVKERYSTLVEEDEARKELRNISIGIILSLTLDYSRAKQKNESFTAGYQTQEGTQASSAVDRRSVLLKERKRKSEKELSEGRSKNAKRQISSAITKEHSIFSEDLLKVINTLRKLPRSHPLSHLYDNFSILTISNIAINKLTASNQYEFIIRGLNTFKVNMLKTNHVINALEKRQKIKLTPQQYLDTFEESVEISRTLANMHLDVFSSTSTKLMGLLRLKFNRFNPKYFSLQFTNKDPENPKWKLAFSEKGNQLLIDERKKFKKKIEKRDVLTVTTRCPARRDGAAKEDDVILNLHRDIVERARKRIAQEAVSQIAV